VWIYLLVGLTICCQVETGSSSQDSGCLLHPQFLRLAIPFPLFHLVGRALAKIQAKAVRNICMPDCTSFASAKWVPSIFELVGEQPSHAAFRRRPPAESRAIPRPSYSRGPNDASHLACLQQTYSLQGLSGRIIDFLLESWWGYTHLAYESAWYRWCRGRQINLLSVALGDIMQFLTDQFDQGLQYQTVNTLHSAISMTHPDVNSHPVGSYLLLPRLLSACSILIPLLHIIQHHGVVNYLGTYMSFWQPAPVGTGKKACHTNGSNKCWQVF